MENKKIDVYAISRLARLDLDAAEAQRLEKEMRQFDDFADCLGELQESNCQNDSFCALELCSREDKYIPTDISSADIVLLSKGANGEYISVPITVGKEDAE